MPVVSDASLKICRHCGRPRSLRRRGLCYGCYFEPGVREKYEPTSAMANRGSGLTVVPARKVEKDKKDRARRPCPFAPGSPERIQKLEDRAYFGLPLWTPGDVRWDFDGNLTAGWVGLAGSFAD
jgi:hypothetical protein